MFSFSESSKFRISSSIIDHFHSKSDTSDNEIKSPSTAVSSSEEETYILLCSFQKPFFS